MDDLRFVIYNGDNEYQRDFVADGTADLKANVIPTASFTIDDDHDAVDAVKAPGARCAVWFRDEEQFRGRIKTKKEAGPVGQLVSTVEGDLRKLWEWYGWPVPSSPITAQTSEYRHYTGSSEKVFKDALAENAARLGVPWTIRPNLNRGQAAVADLRFHPLADKVLESLNRDRLIVTIVYTEAGNPIVDLREPDTVPGVFTQLSGVPNAYSTSSEAPTNTRAIVGGRGEGVEREFKRYIDAGRESTWDDIIETFVDARNTEDGSDILRDAIAAVADGAARSSASFELVETDTFRYLSTYQVGDLVKVRVGVANNVTEQISVAITQDISGVVVEPTIGELATDDTDIENTKAIAQLARSVRDQGRR